MKSFDSGQLVDDLRPEDFEKLRAEIAKTYGPVAMAEGITRVRALFKYAYEAGLIDEPLRFGPTIKRLSQRVQRAERQRRPSRMFEASEIRKMLKAAPQPLHAMIPPGASAAHARKRFET